MLTNESIVNHTSHSVNTLRYTACMGTELTFGEWLEDRYVDAGFNQTTFADAISYHQTTVSGWVTGERRMNSRRACVAIARALGVPVDEVYRRAGLDRRPDPAVAGAVQWLSADLHEIRRDLVSMRSQLNAIIARIDAAQSGTRIVNHPKE